MCRSWDSASSRQHAHLAGLDQVQVRQAKPAAQKSRDHQHSCRDSACNLPGRRVPSTTLLPFSAALPDDTAP